MGRGFSRNWRAITFAHEKKFDAAANWRIAIIIAVGRKEKKKKKKNRARTIGLQFRETLNSLDSISIFLSSPLDRKNRNLFSSAKFSSKRRKIRFEACEKAKGENGNGCDPRMNVETEVGVTILG